MDPAVGASAAVDIPATIPVGQTNDLATYREARDKGLSEIPNPAAPAEAAKPAVVEPTAEVVAAEADSAKPDADLSEAARKLRSNRKDERLKKIAAENDELARALHLRKTLRSELDQLAPGHSTPDASRHAGTTTAIDPRDPEPTLESIAAANPNDADPYALWQRELAKWDRRQEQRAADAVRHADEQRTQATQVRAKLAEHGEAAKGKYSDYDAVILAFDQDLDRQFGPDIGAKVSATISRFLARSKVGGDLGYRVAKDPAVRDAIQGGPDALHAYLGALEASLSAAQPTAGAAPVVSAAPEPHSPVVAASTASTHFDPKTSHDIEAYRRHRDKLLAATG